MYATTLSFGILKPSMLHSYAGQHVELPHQHARGVSSVSGVPEVSSSIGMLMLLLQGEESRRDVLGRLICNTDFYSFHFFNNCNEYKQVCVANSVK